MTNPQQTEGLTADADQAHAWALKVSKAKGSQYTPASKNAAAYILSVPDRPSPPAQEAVVQDQSSLIKVLTEHGFTERHIKNLPSPK